MVFLKNLKKFEKFENVGDFWQNEEKYKRYT
jgi:hypothetical protein